MFGSCRAAGRDRSDSYKDKEEKGNPGHPLRYEGRCCGLRKVIKRGDPHIEEDSWLTIGNRILSFTALENTNVTIG